MPSDTRGKRKRPEEAQGVGYRTPPPKPFAVFGTSCPTKAKEEAVKADPGDGACLLSRWPREERTQACHVVPRRTTRATVEILEKAWGMGKGVLNLDTRYNLLFLMAHYHLQFDDNRWLLFPRPSVINDLVAAYKETDTLGKDITNLYEGTAKFEYVMVPREDMRIITRYKKANSGEISGEVELLNYPYFDLGVLESHVYPHFVIVNAAKKIQSTRETYTKNIAATLSRHFETSEQDARKLVDQVVDLWDKWVPKDVRSSASSSADDADYQLEDSGEGSTGDDSPDESASREDEKRPAKRRTLHRNVKQMGSLPPADHSNEAMDEVPELVHASSTVAATSLGHHYVQSATGSQDNHVRALRPAPTGRTPDLSLLGVESNAEWLERIGCWITLANACKDEYETLDERVDETLMAYRDEPVLKPRTRPWHSWKPKWTYIIPKDAHTRKVVRRRFSSNDWAVWVNDFVLTDPC